MKAVGDETETEKATESGRSVSLLGLRSLAGARWSVKRLRTPRVPSTLPEQFLEQVPDARIVALADDLERLPPHLALRV
jgi:hypothetical protein